MKTLLCISSLVLSSVIPIGCFKFFHLCLLSMRNSGFNQVREFMLMFH